MNSHDTESHQTRWNARTAAQVAAYCRLFPGERRRIAPLLHALKLRALHFDELAA
jgi:hypothetical protein